MDITIASSCKIINGSVVVNGKEVYAEQQTEGITKFMSNVYRKIELAYPKFFKMDALCKLGVLTAELAIKNWDSYPKHDKGNIAICLSNNASSIETDRNYIKTIENKKEYFPSPSLFVYTLPNIIIGEIAIKHKITGENVFFVSEKFDFEFLSNYISTLFLNKNITSVICGWVNVDGNDYESFVFCLEKSNFNDQERREAGIPFNLNTVNQIIKRDYERLN